jgi:hypothetical protein
MWKVVSTLSIKSAMQMKEYLITYTLNGRRTKRRIWAYHISDAYKRIRDEEPPKSQIGWIKSEQIK